MKVVNPFFRIINIIIHIKLLILSSLIIVFSSCNSSNSSSSVKDTDSNYVSTQYFLLDNNFEVDETISDIIDKSNLKKGGYVLIIPTSFTGRNKQANRLKQAFRKQQISAVHVLNIKPNKEIKNTDIIAIENANVICFLDGTINKFTKLVNNTRLKASIIKASKNGTTIAGIGKGASIIGDYYLNQIKNSKTQVEELKLKYGLGLIKNTVIGNIALINNFKEDIIQKSTNKSFVFIGLDKAASIYIEDFIATILSKTGAELISPDNIQDTYNFGEKFTLSNQ